MSFDASGNYTSDYFGQSGDSADAGTSALDSGTTSDSGGGSDYIDRFFQLANTAASAYLSGRPGPTVQPALTQGKPVQQPGSVVGGGAQPGVIGFVSTYQTEILLGFAVVLGVALVMHFNK